MTLAGLMNWWNLVYVVPFGLAVVYLFLYTVTGVTFGDVDGDAHVEADGHVDMDAQADVEAHADVDADGDADADHDVDHDADHENEGGRSLSVLALLGVGRVPLSLLLMIFLILWGIIGFGLNMALTSLLDASPTMAVISLPVTLVAATLLTGTLARVMGRLMPTSETYSRSVESLVGRRAESISAIDETFGLAQVRQGTGDLFQVPCRVAKGRKPIAKAVQIVLYEYDATTKQFYVAEFGTWVVGKPRQIKSGDGPGPEPDEPVEEVHAETKPRELQ